MLGMCLEFFEFAWNSGLLGMLGVLGMCLEFVVAWNAWNVLGIQHCVGSPHFDMGRCVICCIEV